jgi:hypothetical protein
MRKGLKLKDLEKYKHENVFNNFGNQTRMLVLWKFLKKGITYNNKIVFKLLKK